jgi:thiosulfate/3-mercaptopyruvate sulfurtransferase
MFDTLISATQLQQNYQADHWVVLDCRFDLMDVSKGEALYQACHIENAIYVNLNEQLSGTITALSGRHPLPEIAALTNLFSKLGIGSHSQVVVYDDCGGAIAARAWWLLKWLGHESVALLDGGIQSWQALGYACSDVSPDIIETHFVRKHSVYETLSTQQICSGDYQLIDARASARYLGEVEPIDAIAGHVPGAVNYPFSDNLNEQGLFKSKLELLNQWQGIADTNNVHMCGSGVTACHNILSMVYAGLPVTRLYTGSWSEWIRDSSRPVSSV